MKVFLWVLLGLGLWFLVVGFWLAFFKGGDIDDD